MRLVKDAIKGFFHRFGYDIVRLGHNCDAPFNLLELVVRAYVSAHERFYFVQIGANNGIRGDHLYPLVLAHHFQGLLVEPLPDQFEALRRNYAAEPQVKFENCAIANEEGSCPLYRFRRAAAVPDWAYGMASFDKRHLTKFENTAALGPYIEAVSVSTMTFASLMAKHGIRDVSLLDIDTEGYDYEILKMAFAAGCFPPIINFEHQHLRGPALVACHQALVKHRYQYVNYGRDTLALRQSVESDPC